MWVVHLPHMTGEYPPLEPRYAAMNGKLSMGLALYRSLTRCLAPVVPLLLEKRMARGKEDPARRDERLGIASRQRAEGRLVWLHAASVGESLSVLPLVDELLAAQSDIHVLVTTGTVTSAKLMADRLPERAFHQYVPLDHPTYCGRFLDHWSPDLAVWIESEFWPNLILEADRRSIPLVLVNARITERSFRNWQRAPGFIGDLLSRFRLLMAQDGASAARLRLLGASEVAEPGNLKHDAAALTYDPAALERLRSEIGNRPIWLASSTHEGEERIAAEVHQALVARFPDLLTIIVPRHPVRGEKIASELRSLGLTVARRTADEPVTSGTAIYLADTLGEMGLFYTLCDIVFIGGTLDNRTGGHNPYEAARLGCALIAGPCDFNFAEPYEDFTAKNAMQRVIGTEDLSDAVDCLLSDEAVRRRMSDAAYSLASQGSGATKRTADALLALLRATADQKGAPHA